MTNHLPPLATDDKNGQSVVDSLQQRQESRPANIAAPLRGEKKDFRLPNEPFSPGVVEPF
ncbi:hypothetical protein [Pontiella sp.]|uniref:hypothetical protein n=1 Tax=Pontiella sp. TaxID=2837462 RepID=UPI00356B5646